MIYTIIKLILAIWVFTCGIALGIVLRLWYLHIQAEKKEDNHV